MPQEIDGVMMPDDVFKPVVGGKYAVFGISLPEAYVCDNASKTGASWDMFRKAAAYLHEHSDYLFTFGGKLDGIWAKRNWEAIKDRLVPGGTVLFQDNQLQADGVRIRITGIRQSLNDPHSPELTLSNETIGQRLLGRIEQAESQAVLIDASASSQRQFTKRTFRDAKETMQALDAALKSFSGEFTAGISPITVNTMQLLVGSERCQFEFVAGLQSTTVVGHNAWFDKADKKFHCASGFVRYSYGNTMSANGQDAARTASVGAFDSVALTDADQSYYVHIRIAKNAPTVGNFLVAEQAYAHEVDGYIYLLLGILDKEQFGNRTWSPMYGYTEITPGRIRVDKIISSDGNTYFDLPNNEIGGRINFKDGLVSGEIGVGGSIDAVRAGMNGRGGTNPVRFWAGAEASKMYSAPFIVYDNGDTVMNSAMIGGDSVFGGLLKQNVITLNSDSAFFENNSSYGMILRWEKLLKYRTTIIVQSLPDYSYKSDLFSLNSGGNIIPPYFSGDLYNYIGNRVRIINKSGKTLVLGQSMLSELGDYGDTISKTLISGSEIDIEFVINNLKDDGLGNQINKKVMAWYILYQGPIVNTEAD